MVTWTQLFQPNYGYALVIKEGEKSLTSMKNSQPNSYTHVAENYILSGNVEQAVAYNVVSEYIKHTKLVGLCGSQQMLRA